MTFLCLQLLGSAFKRFGAEEISSSKWGSISHYLQLGGRCIFDMNMRWRIKGGWGTAPAPLLWRLDERVPYLLKDLNSQRLRNHFLMDRRAIGNINFYMSYYLSNVLVTIASLQSSQVCSPCSPVATLTTAIIVRDICRVSGFIDVNFSTNVVEIW